MSLAAILSGGMTFAADAPATSGDAAAKTEAKSRRERIRDAAEMTPEERKKRRHEMAAKREAKLKELHEKKAAGTLTETEQKALDRMEKAGQPGPGGRTRTPKKDQPEK